MCKWLFYGRGGGGGHVLSFKICLFLMTIVGRGCKHVLVRFMYSLHAQATHLAVSAVVVDSLASICYCNHHSRLQKERIAPLCVCVCVCVCEERSMVMYRTFSFSVGLLKEYTPPKQP